jgi:hypothetical protein
MRKLAIALSILTSVCVVAQTHVLPGNLTGQLVDSKGAAVGDVAVTATEFDYSKTVVSNDEGFFLFPLLKIGTYSLTIQKSGYKNVRIERVDVPSGKSVTSRIPLQEGSSSDLVIRESDFKEVVVTVCCSGPNLNVAFYPSTPVPKKPAGALKGTERHPPEPPASEGSRLPDLSESAKKACDPKKGEFWDEQKGCMWVVDWDFGSEPIGIDPQSSTVQRNISDYEFNRLPAARSVSDIIKLP